MNRRVYVVAMTAEGVSKVISRRLPCAVKEEAA